MSSFSGSGFVDIHHHLIYGVDDDGPRTLEDSRKMLALAYQDGTRHIVATPHFDPVGKCPDVAFLKSRLAELSAICKADYPDLTLSLGAEVFFGEGFRRKLRAGLIPTMAGSEYVLVEFVPAVTRENLEKAIRHLANGGFVTILAHAERYPAITRNLPFVKYLKEKYGTLIQINSSFVLQRKFFHLRRFLKKGLKENLIDFIASDAHNAGGRRTQLRSAYTALNKFVDKNKLRTIFQSNFFQTTHY